MCASPSEEPRAVSEAALTSEHLAQASVVAGKPHRQLSEWEFLLSQAGQAGHLEALRASCRSRPSLCSRPGCAFGCS